MSEERFDYVLARIQRRGEDMKYVLRKYEANKSNILDKPLAEASGKTLPELADKVCSRNCLPWSKDRVIGYNGPQVAIDLGTIVYPLNSDDSLAKFMGCLPSD